MASLRLDSPAPPQMLPEPEPQPQPQLQGSTRRVAKRKRQDMAGYQRRAAHACDTCRRQKEKCEGGPPCGRCFRLRRPCRFQGPQSETRVDTATTTTTARSPPTPSSSGPNSKKIDYLQRIAQHFLGDISLDEESLGQIAEKIERNKQRDDDPSDDALDVESEFFDVKFVSQNLAHYSGEFSLWNFSQKVRRTMNSHLEQLESDDLSQTMRVKDYWRPTQLQLPVNVILESFSQLPPRNIADFLVNIFFKYGQVNCFFVEEEWLKEKLDLCYTQWSEFSPGDVAWVCTIFTILAIGTQIAHMEAQRPDHTPEISEDFRLCSEDAVGVVFYHTACRLIPDVITLASQESVQAFLLLAQYAFPLSTGGLTYTYLGIAIKMAVLNGMHRKYVGDECDEKTIETRNRLFWTAYTLEKRISVIHGRPGSIAESEINADLPTNFACFKSPNFANMTAFIQLNNWLGEIADALKQFKRCPKRLLPEYSQRIMRLRDRIKQWWTTLPQKNECRDLNPRGPLFRQNVHLRLCYLQIWIYIGRPFLFYEHHKERDPSNDASPSETPTTTSIAASRAILVSDCVQSALKIIDILQLLSYHVGLCRASYTEFSSCRSALLVIIAQSMNVRRTKELRDALTQGMKVIKQLTGGTSAESEISVIESLETAIRYLDSVHDASNTVSDDKSQSENTSIAAYARFKNWAQMLKAGSSGGGSSAASCHSGIVEISSFSPPFNMAAPTSSESVQEESDGNRNASISSPSWLGGFDWFLLSLPQNEE